MEYRKLEEIIQFNPTETIKKDTISKKISMDKLDNFKKYVNSFDLEEYKGGAKFKNGDTLFARITPCLENGKTAKVSILGENEIGFGSTEYIVMRKRNNISDEDFIYYLAISPEFRNIAIKSMTGTSGRQRVQLDVLKNTEMLLPSYEEQKKIGKILSSLDEKIELNNKINNNLYEICNLIYHSFLDKYSNLIIDTKLVDIAKKVITGKTPSTKNEEFWNGNIPFITIPDMHNQVFTINTERTISKLGAKSIIPKNSISVSCIATVGLVSITTEESQTNQQINSIIINNDYDLYYLFEFLSEQAEYLKNIACGSTTYNINKKTFENIVIPYLPENLLKKFNDQVSCLFERIKENQIENKNLEQLRDTLLPKLMNGEIDLDKIEI